MEDKKKSKKGLIIGIITAVVLAGGAVAAFFILNRGSSPESVALDAITKTIKDTAHKMEGKLEVTTPVASATGTSSAKVIFELNGENNGMNSSSSATITVKAGGTSDFVFRFNEVLEKDGTFYIKPSDLTAFVKSITSSYSQYLSVEPLATIVSEVEALATKISANWWRISVPEVLEALGADGTEVKKQFDCSIAATNELVSESGLETIANIYKDNQFLNVKKAETKPSAFTGDAYEATVDTSKLAKFWNEYVTSDKVKKLNDCAGDSYTLSAVTPDELSAVSGRSIFLDIDKDHNLKGVSFNDSKDGYNVDANFRIEKGSEDLAIAAPSGAKPITELTADIMNLVQSVASLFASTQTTVE